MATKNSDFMNYGGKYAGLNCLRIKLLCTRESLPCTLEKTIFTRENFPCTLKNCFVRVKVCTLEKDCFFTLKNTVIHVKSMSLTYQF